MRAHRIGMAVTPVPTRAPQLLTFIARVVDGDALKRRVVVLGAGPRAARLERLAARPGASFCVAGYVANLAEHVVASRAGELATRLAETGERSPGLALPVRWHRAATRARAGASARSMAWSRAWCLRVPG